MFVKIFMMSTTAIPAIPNGGLRWGLTAEQVKAEAEAITAKADGVLNRIAATLTDGGAAACTWDAVVAPLAELDRELEPATSSVTFLKDVSVDKDVRAAAAAAQSALSAWEIKAGMRKDVYDAVAAYAAGAFAADKPRMDAEAVRFVERTLRDYKRRGLALPEGPRKEVEALKTRISDLCVAFQQRLAEEDRKLYFPRDALRGMPDDFVASLAVKTAAEVEAATGSPPAAGSSSSADGTFLEVELNYPHVVPLLKLCAVPATRAAVEAAFNSRAHPANTGALEELAELRRRVAGLLGYPSHAAYVLEEKMAGNPATVASFLSELGRDLKPLHAADLASLGALKAAEEGADSGPITMADYRYYMEAELKSKYAVDGNAIKEYFPLQTVLDGMFDIYQRLLSLTFTKIDAEAVAAYVWHPDVAVYAVTDARDGSLVGYFHLDLHPRQGKYGHAAVFPLISGCEAGPAGLTGDAARGRVLPVAAMVCNFTKPTDKAPSLLRHEEVVTLFHEFGHVAHHLCSTTRLHRFSSFRCEQDFVESPSQMLENWCWVPAMLQRMSGHWRSGEQLPSELADKLAASHKAHAGLLNTRQVFLASFDQALHTLPSDAPGPVAVDTTALLVRLHADILGIPHTPGTNFGASFGHLAGGYDSQYYGYLWSEVYSADMFTLFASSPLDAAAGLRYRQLILASGGARDAADFLRDFLGRPPSNAAFLRSKGLEVKSA